MAVRLDAGTDDRQGFRGRTRQQARRHRRNRRGARLGNVAAVEQRAQGARFRIEQHDRREMAGQAPPGIGPEDGDQLGSERSPGFAFHRSIRASGGRAWRAEARTMIRASVGGH